MNRLPAAPAPDDEAAAGRTALAVIAGFALARVALAFTIGFGVDESYTVAIARRLQLSYFDHPPLHQWIAHFTALLLGEGPAMRLPFIALFAATGWLIFALTRRLFSARAGLWAVFGLNASAFFFVSAGGWIVPDGPLLFALAAAALVFARLFFDDLAPAEIWLLWLAGGLFLGLAGLSKYSAVFAPLSLIVFISMSPRQHHWFAHPAPYVAALLALAIISPVIIWNADNHWASLVFQGGRGVPGADWRPGRLAAMVIGEIAWLTPWIFPPLVGGLIDAVQRARLDERRLYLLCLALPPILFFTLIPLWGAGGLPHWPMPGWLFAYPLTGAWLTEGWVSAAALRRWAIGSTALLAVIIVALAAQTTTGWLTRLSPQRSSFTDPTLEALPWDKLRGSPLLDGGAAPAPAFVVATKWSDAGKIAMALGPAMPVIVDSDDPRGWAFPDDSAKFVGKDAVVIVPQGRLASLAPLIAPYFASLGEPRTVTLGRGGANEIVLALAPARGLTQPFPLPYPR